MNGLPNTAAQIPSLPESQSGTWGAAAKCDFDNPDKWVTVKNVPLLDEHVMTDDEGKPLANVTKHDLEQIAANNNKRVYETGDPATLILGHTSDDPNSPEKPAKGFAVNYKVLPFKRDPRTGRTIYAVHGDYKLRPRHAHLIEDFPRRSVELWWNKKELDPIAMLGGTTPERDLGVVMRMSRMQHIALLGGTTPARDLSVARFSRRGAAVVEAYEINDRYPKRYSSTNTSSGDCSMPAMPAKFSAIDQGDDQGLPFGDESQGGAPGADAGTDFDDAGGDDGGGFGDGGDAPEDDVMVEKVMQSKPFKDMQNKLDMILQALQEQGGGGAAAAPAPGGPDDGMTPPPDEMGGGSPVGGAGGDGMGGAPDDMEERRDHGEQPVQFSGTGFAGPGSTSVPTFGKKFKRPTPTGSKTVAQTNTNPVLIKMQRRLEASDKLVKDMALKLSRTEAEKSVNALESEGIVFGNTPEAHEAGKAEEIEFLTVLTDGEREQQINVMRTRYARRRPDPANPVNPGIARFSRTGAGGGVTPEDDYEPTDPAEASLMADLEVRGKMSRAEAVKYMRSRNK